MRSIWRRLFGNYGVAATWARPNAATPVRARVAATTIQPGNAPAACPAATPDEIEDRFHRFVFGLPDSDAHQLSSAELATLNRLEPLSKRFDMRSLPRLPAVLPQLLRMLKSDKSSGGQVAKLVGRDPLMVGEVMRATSSVYYRSAQPITSLQQAVILMGQEGLHRVLTQHVMKPILQASGIAPGRTATGERLWDHAERCSHACAWFAKNSGGSDTFEAYLAGIICQTGTGAVVRLLDRLMPSPPEAVSSAFLAGCARLAARLSVQAAHYWELPPAVIDALTERQNAGRQPVSTPLGKALLSANLLAMAQVLGEHELISGELDFDEGWPDSYPPSLLARCQLDMRNNFPPDEDA